jgi:predicted nucleic acid-binding protein
MDGPPYWDIQSSNIGLPTLELTDVLCGHSAYNYFSCRKKGLTLSTIDCLIATLAGQNKIPLWTLDKTLRKAAPLIGCEPFTP